MADSDSPVIGEMVFVHGSVSYPVPLQEFFQSWSCEIAADGTWFGTLTLFDVDDVLERRFLAAGLEGKILFRWGWPGLGGIAGLPTYTAAIMSYRPSFTPQGTQYVLQLMPDITLLGLLNRRIIGWPANKPLSDIVKAIAKLRGYSQHDARGRPTIQPIEASLPEPISTSGESDIKFMREYLVPYARDDYGRGGFEVYVDEFNALHFHNDHFRPPTLAKQYTAYRDSMGEVREFSPTTDQIFGAIMGAGNTTYQSTDSDGGVRTEVRTDVYAGVPGAKNTVTEGASAKPDIGEEAHSRVSIYERTPEMFQARVASQYAMLSRLACNARLVVRGTHDFTINDFVGVDYYRRDGDKHYLSGNYQVKRILHTWDAGGWWTDMDLMRSGLAPVPGTRVQEASVQVAVVPTSQTKVAGHDGSGPDGAGMDAKPLQDGGQSYRNK